MNYAAAAKYSESAPCTNVPIYCPLCSTENGAPCTIWKYNTWLHLAYAHEHLTKADLPPSFIIDSYISKKEGQAMGAEEDLLRRWRETNQIPGSDDIQLAEERVATSKQERAASSVVKEPKSKKRAP